MKLFVIVLCLLSERYLVHSISHSRFYWFPSYFAAISQKLLKSEFSLFNQLSVLALVVFIPLIIFGLFCYFLGWIFFGFIGFLLHLIVFYYCLGPQNPFYPVFEQGEQDNETVIRNYFAKVNGELFAVIFWYIVFGPLGSLFYRLVSLCREQLLTADLARNITDVLDWIPTRITVLLYLLAGNFQRGIHFFGKMFFATPYKNYTLLGEAGLLAAKDREEEVLSIPNAERLVEQALIIYLVFLAFFTLVSWL
jgi:AmpE protein